MRGSVKQMLNKMSLGVVVVAAVCLTGCTIPYGPQFREVALPAIQTGVHSILDGFVNGVFATIEPENDG